MMLSGRLWLFFLLFAFVLIAKAEPLNSRDFSNYQLGSGDKIKIQVFGEDDLNMEASLTEAGTIFHPLLGEMRVVGLTVGQLADRITKELKGRYLVDPKVSVSVLQYREYFINGEVRAPGAYPYLPGLTVEKAVTRAGGFTDRASRSSIVLQREKKKPGDTSDEDVDLNTPIAPGDIISIEQSFF